MGKQKQTQLFNLILRGEPPRSFYNESTWNLHSECKKLLPSLTLIWIPPSAWQIGFLHAFFHNTKVCEGVLKYLEVDWEPLEYEQLVHHNLPLMHSLQEIAELFDSYSQSFPDILQELFFHVNEHVRDLYDRAGGSDLKMVHLAVFELPPFKQWSERRFPFLKAPWVHNPGSAELFYGALQDAHLLSEVLKVERLAYERGEWVLYRGYSGVALPSTLQLDSIDSHALSFGSTLLGGSFFH